MLQRATDWRDPLQLVVAQVQLHQPRHVEGVGRDALVCQLVVGHPHILQLSQAAQETLGQRVDGVGLHVELVQVFRKSLRDLRGVYENGRRRTSFVLGQSFGDLKSFQTVTFVSWLLLTSRSVRDVSVFRDEPISLIPLLLRYRAVRLSMPSTSAAITCQRWWFNLFSSIKLQNFMDEKKLPVQSCYG